MYSLFYFRSFSYDRLKKSGLIVVNVTKLYALFPWFGSKSIASAEVRNFESKQQLFLCSCDCFIFINDCNVVEQQGKCLNVVYIILSSSEKNVAF